MVHILLSTYNGGKYIKEQLDSILAQTCKDWHLFIRDDGSNDNTIEIIRHYAKAYYDRITYIEDQIGRGAKDAYAWLLEHYACSDYTAFADQDDVWMPDKLSVALETMREAERQYGNIPLAVHTDLQVVDENLDEISPSFWHYSNINPQWINTNPHYLAICNTATGCTMLINRNAVDATLPFKNEAYMHDAWIALKIVVSGGRLIAVNKPTIKYRQHGDNTLGAEKYKFTLKNIKHKIWLAQRSYNQGKDVVFGSVLSFIFWKTVYFVRLHFTN